MTRDVVVVPTELSLMKSWQIMQKHHIRHLPVVRVGALVGMLSDRDVLRHGSLDLHGILHVPKNLFVGEAMTPVPLKTCEISTSVSDLAQIMTEDKIDAIPIVRGLHLLGLVTSSDLIELLIERDEARPLPFDFRVIDDPRAYA